LDFSSIAQVRKPFESQSEDSHLLGGKVVRKKKSQTAPHHEPADGLESGKSRYVQKEKAPSIHPGLDVDLASRTDFGLLNVTPEKSDPLDKLFDNIHIGIAYLDRDANFIRVNRTLADSVGKDPDYFIGKNSFELNPNAEGRALFERVAQSGRPFAAYNLPYQDPAHPERGTTYWDWSLQPITESDGAVSGMIFSAVEVTDRKRAELALEETQALFELLFESAPDANVLTDGEGNILALNAQAEHIFGYRRQELIGKEIEILLPQRFARKHSHLRADYIKSPRLRPMGQGLDLFALKKNGEEIPVNVTLSPLETEHGLLVLAVVRDMTEARKVERSLSIVEARFHAIFDNAAIGIQLLNAGGNILETNPAMQSMLGFTGKELLGMNFLEFTFEEDASRNIYLFQSLVQGKIRRYHLEKRYRRKDSTLFWGRLNVSQFIDDPGQSPFVIAMVEDINELKNAEEALRHSEERSRTSLETLLDGFAIFSPVRNKKNKIVDFKYDYINEAGCQLNQRPREDHIGHTMLEIRPGIKDSDLLDKYIQVVETGQPLMLESYSSENKPGSGPQIARAFDIKAVRLGDGLAVAWQDITRRKQAEEALRQQEEMLRAVIETLPVGVWITDKDGKIIFGNQAGHAIWGGIRYVRPEEYDQYRVKKASTGMWIKPEQSPVWRAIRNGEVTLEEEDVIHTFDDQEKTILNSAAPIWGENHQITGAIIVNQDITERKNIQAELAEVQRQLLNQAEEQRVHLARELHDGPIQDLYGITFQISELGEKATAEGEQEMVRKLSANLQQTITALRSIMSELRPPTLAPFGLEKTIRSHANSYQSQHPEIKLHLDLMHDAQALPEPVRLALFRIYQESLNNILRHAKANNIYVHFTFDENSAEIRVEDDGVGFEVPRHWVELARYGHYGLVGMRERAEALGGQFELVSKPGKGTRYRAAVPLKLASQS
jgi:PAS domain S-box-containing protein